MTENADEALGRNATDPIEGQGPSDDWNPLVEGMPSVTQGIADAVVAKNGNLYFLTRPDGSVPLKKNHGYGLYYRDCRYLKGYRLQIEGCDPNPLVANARRGYSAVVELSNPAIRPDTDGAVPMGTVGIKMLRVIDAGELELHDRITFKNYSRERVSFEASLDLVADFSDIFAVRGMLPMRPGRDFEPIWENDRLHFLYYGADGIYRSLTVRFSPSPYRVEETTAYFQFDLQPRQNLDLLVTFFIEEDRERDDLEVHKEEQPDLHGIEDYFKEASENWLADQTRVRSDSLALNAILDRSLRDLRTLRSQIHGEDYFAAGVPWYVTLFGRDSLITSLQTLAFNPRIADDTLRLLARYQGREKNDWRDEQPGKILHELRIGELAHLGEIPHTPYYGSVDATPLFLYLVAQYARWTGSLEILHQLREPVDRALAWLDEYGDLDGDGFIEYASASERGLRNQGWKDSGDSIVRADGSQAEPPIALVEVQGYVYMAKLGLAEIFERDGQTERAEKLRREAYQLKQNFNRHFWLEECGSYALALEVGNRPVDSLTSNPGHVLYAGLADEDKANRMAQQLMSDDLFNGWGIRTLSAANPAYNPVGYHLGTVWPHDNSLIVSGLRRYGLDQAARRVFQGIVEAAMNFEHYRLPELFSGFRKDEYNVPVFYPVACHPQAWAAGAVPFMLTSLMGLVPEGFERRLRVVRPSLPEFLDVLHVRGLWIGGGTIDLDYERTRDGACAVRVVNVEGDVDVLIADDYE